MVTYLVVISKQDTVLTDSIALLVQSDIINEYRSRTTRRRGIAFGAQTNHDLVHVAQVDSLVGKGL
jgi:hypothetical protein